MENEYVIGAYPYDNDEDGDVNTGKVGDLKDVVIDTERDRNAHGDV